MKKLLTLFVLLLSLLTISCSKDDDAAATTDDLLLGRWYYVSGANAVKEVAPSKRLAIDEKTTKYIEFKKDGVFAQGQQTGTIATDESVSSYTKSDNTISITSATKGIVSTISVSTLNATDLIIVYGKNSGREGDTETYTKNSSNAANFN